MLRETKVTSAFSRKCRSRLFEFSRGRQVEKGQHQPIGFLPQETRMRFRLNKVLCAAVVAQVRDQ